MKRHSLKALFALIAFLFPARSNAQYTSIVNQVTNLVQTAAYGGPGYKGYVDASYTGGFGNIKADFLGFSTTQGAQIAPWFFLGAGIGVDVVFSKTTTSYEEAWRPDKKTRTCGAMIPVFSDFRFNLGNPTGTSMFIDIKAGGSFLMGGEFLAIENGYISSSEYFMLKPTVGIRVPMSKSGKTAVNLGVTYQLLTCNYWWYNNRDSGTLNSIGATAAFEW